MDRINSYGVGNAIDIGQILSTIFIRDSAVVGNDINYAFLKPELQDYMASQEIKGRISNSSDILLSVNDLTLGMCDNDNRETMKR